MTMSLSGSAGTWKGAWLGTTVASSREPSGAAARKEEHTPAKRPAPPLIDGASSTATVSATRVGSSHGDEAMEYERGLRGGIASRNAASEKPPPPATPHDGWHSSASSTDTRRASASSGKRSPASSFSAPASALPAGAAAASAASCARVAGCESSTYSPSSSAARMGVPLVGR